jgi:hypothetical protein
MSTEKEQTEIPRRDWPTFDDVYRSLLELMENIDESNRFPQLKLKNRLLNLGLKQFLEPIDEKGVQPRRALEVYGLPFRFVTQWDEAILALAHFLNRFREEEKSELHVYAMHRLAKGEDKTLSDWHTAKAKLYLELHNIILLLNDIGGRKAQISRIFAFSKIADVAFWTQSAVSLLAEQVAAGIKVGFLFTDTFPRDEVIGEISNNLLIDFRPHSQNQASHQFHFYAMHELVDDRNGHTLPFKEGCAAKWFKNSSEAFLTEPHLEKILNLFPKPNKYWEKPNYENPNGVYRLDGPVKLSENHIFNSAVVTMANAFERYRGADVENFNNRINQTVITGDWIRLQRAISAFDDPTSIEIKAVDATSVKNSLSIHESDPTYRHWLRSSLSRVLKFPDKSLRRIYIIDDKKPKAFEEFSKLQREMQYYLDYFHYEISEMSSVLFPEGVIDRRNNCNPKSFSKRINVFVTTSTVLRELAHDKVDRDVLAELIPKLDTTESLTLIDFISSNTRTEGEGMIYNFLNQRADPGELKFEAFLFRKPFDGKREERILFDYLNDLNSDKLRNHQLQSRMMEFARGIVSYETAYSRILKDQMRDRVNEINLMKQSLDAGHFERAKLTELIDIRGEFEKRLYEYFEERFSYVYRFLEYYSLEVQFFREPTARLIQHVEPFEDCEDAEKLRGRIQTSVISKKNEPPRFEPREVSVQSDRLIN